MRRLSIAVLVNGSYSIGAEGERVYQERGQEELERLAALVRSAAGYDESRGDSVEVVNLRFADLEIIEEDLAGLGMFGFARGEMIRAAELLVLGIVAVLLLIFVVRPLLKQAIEIANSARRSEDGRGEYPDLLTDPNSPQTALAGPNLPLGQAAVRLPGQAGQGGDAAAYGQMESLDEEIENVIDINKVDGQVRASSLRKITEIVENNPEEAASIVRSWLYQDG